MPCETAAQEALRPVTTTEMNPPGVAQTEWPSAELAVAVPSVTPQKLSESVVRVVAISGRAAKWVEYLCITLSDGTEHKWGDPNDNPRDPDRDPKKDAIERQELAANEWVVRVTNIHAAQTFLGAGIVFGLNTGRVVDLVGHHAWSKKHHWQFNVSDAASEHVIGLTFSQQDPKKLGALQVANISASPPADAPTSQVTKVSLTAEQIKSAIDRTRASKERAALYCGPKFPVCCSKIFRDGCDVCLCVCLPLCPFWVCYKLCGDDNDGVSLSTSDNSSGVFDYKPDEPDDRDHKWNE